MISCKVSTVIQISRNDPFCKDTIKKKLEMYETNSAEDPQSILNKSPGLVYTIGTNQCRLKRLNWKKKRLGIDHSKETKVWLYAGTHRAEFFAAFKRNCRKCWLYDLMEKWNTSYYYLARYSCQKLVASLLKPFLLKRAFAELVSETLKLLWPSMIQSLFLTRT